MTQNASIGHLEGDLKGCAEVMITLQINPQTEKLAVKLQEHQLWISSVQST